MTFFPEWSKKIRKTQNFKNENPTAFRPPYNATQTPAPRGGRAGGVWQMAKDTLNPKRCPNLKKLNIFSKSKKKQNFGKKIKNSKKIGTWSEYMVGGCSDCGRNAVQTHILDTHRGADPNSDHIPSKIPTTFRPIFQFLTFLKKMKILIFFIFSENF